MSVGGIINTVSNCLVVLSFGVALCIPVRLAARDFPVFEKSDRYDHRLIISPDGSRVMLLHKKRTDGNDYLQVNGDYRDRASSISRTSFSGNGIAAYDRQSADRASSAVIVYTRGNARMIDNARDIRINRDGTDYLYLKDAAREPYRYVCGKDRQLGPFYSVENHHFNAQGTLFGFAGQDKKYTVHVNQRVFGPYDYASAPVFSSRGGRFAFGYEQNGKHFCFIDEKILGPYEAKRDVIFSPDGSRFFLVSRDHGKMGLFSAERMIAGPFNSIGPLTLSDNGGSFAFTCSGTGLADTCFNYGCAPVIGLGRKANYCCSLSWLNSITSGTSPGFPESSSAFVQFNDRRFGGFTDAGNPITDRQGNSVAFRFERKNGYFVRFNGMEFGPYDFVLGPRLDDSGKHLLYYYHTGTLSRGIRHVLRHDDREYEIRDRIIRMGLTADGTRSCCVYGEAGRTYLMVDGALRGPFDVAEIAVRENRIFTAWVAKGRLHLEEAR